MIIETKEDVVRLSGSLHKNQWLTIKAAANLLLHNFPGGIIVDCSELEEVSEDGARTFLQAMRDIEAAKTRIVVANLPEKVMAVLRTVPGVRSQLPTAPSVEAARASLRMHDRQTVGHDGGKKGAIILVPLIAGLDLTYGAALAGRMARASRAEVRLVYFLEVTRTLPLNAPLQEKEQEARDALNLASQQARQANTPAHEHVERVRDAAEGILASIKTFGVEMVVLGATSEPIGGDGHDRFHQIVDTLLHRAQCEVVIGRLKLPG